MKTLRIATMLVIFSFVLLSCKEEDVEPQLPALAEWEGQYVTQTQWWGTYYSPLVITDNGGLIIAGHEIEYAFDELTGRLTFDWHDIKDQRAKGDILFSRNINDLKQFSGSINPRAQDGPVSYTGVAM